MMVLNLSISAQTEAKLKAKAAAAGVDMETYAARQLERMVETRVFIKEAGEKILSSPCDAGQAAVLSQNSWKCVPLGTFHFRVHPPTSDAPLSPAGPVRYTAFIERLDAEDLSWGRADEEAIRTLAQLFGALN
jgi:hypothetical protein